MLAIKNGTIVTTTSTVRGDVLVDGERILDMGMHDLPEEIPSIDAAGCLILPGVIDCHLHFSLVSGPFITPDDFTSGSAAAAAGGVTCYIDFLRQFRGQTFGEAIARRQAEAVGSSYVDYGFHLNATDLTGGQLGELESVVRQGITSIKIYTTYKTDGFYADDWTWYTLLRRSTEHGILVQAHCENDDILAGMRASLLAQGKTAFRWHGISRPAMAETETVRRGLYLAACAGAPSYYVHQSVADSVDAIVGARSAGQLAIAETCPHFLVLTDDVYEGSEPERFMMTPPLRDKENQDRLWQHVSEGNISCIGSDHCAFSLEQRRTSDDFSLVPPGIPGTELLLPLLYSQGVVRGRISLEQLVQLIAANPAQVFGLAPEKGEIRPGRHADLVIFDPSARWTVTKETLHSAAGYTPYEGMVVQGRVRTTISRGVVVYDRGQFPISPGHGRFVPRHPFQPRGFVPAR